MLVEIYLAWLFLNSSLFFFLNCRSNLSLIEQCFEFVFLVTTAHEDGATTFYSSGGLGVLASQMSALPDGKQFRSCKRGSAIIISSISL